MDSEFIQQWKGNFLWKGKEINTGKEIINSMCEIIKGFSNYPENESRYQKLDNATSVR